MDLKDPNFLDELMEAALERHNNHPNPTLSFEYRALAQAAANISIRLSRGAVTTGDIHGNTKAA